MTFILALVLAPFIMLTLCFTAEILAGLKPLPNPMRAPQAGQMASAVIIVPAHDEAKIIGRTLPELFRAAAHQARIVLVADNCADATAELARKCGVEVIERFDNERRGKGFALDFACNYLRSNSPDVVLVIDADCQTDETSIARLISTCAATGSPSQSTYLQASALGGSPAVQLSTFAFYIKNVVRQRALVRLAGRAHLLGTGMAIPWSTFSSANLATDDIVEDLKLGQQLAEAGHPPIFVEDATVWGDAETEVNTLSQRSRWEGGFLVNALRSGPSMFGRGLIQRNGRASWAAVNVMIPPIAFLVLVDVVMLVMTGIMTEVTASSPWPVVVLLGSLVAAAVALIFAWGTGGSRFVSIGGLARMPFYVIWKLPMYVGFLRSGIPKEWVRTGRDRD